MAEEPPKPRAQDKISLTGRSDDIVRYSLTVFRISSFTLLLILLVFSAYFLIAEIKSIDYNLSYTIAYFLLFSAKTLLTLAAVGIFAAMLGHRLQKGWIVAFAFMVLAALVVPTYEVIRYVNTLTGSGNAIESNSFNAIPIRISTYRSSGSSYKGGILENGNFVCNNEAQNIAISGSPFAHKISNHVRELSERERLKHPENWYCELRRLIDSEVTEYFEIESLAQVRIRGNENLFMSIYMNQFPSLMLGVYGDPETESELSLLRSDGLISYIPSDAWRPSPTIYGCRVAARLKFEHEDQPVARVSAIPACKDMFPPTLASPSPTPVDENILAMLMGYPPDNQTDLEVVQYDFNEKAIPIEIGNNTSWLVLDVSNPPSNGNNRTEIELNSAETDPTDPAVIIYKDGDTSPIASNDDQQGSLNSSLVVSLDSGKYLVGTGSIIGPVGQAELIIRPAGD